jgi:hypothetical protein
VLVPRLAPFTNRFGAICCGLMLTVGCPPIEGVQAVATPVVVVVVVLVGAAVTCACAPRDATPSAVIDVSTRHLRAKRCMPRSP